MLKLLTNKPNIINIEDPDYVFIYLNKKELFKTENVNEFVATVFPNYSDVYVFKRDNYILFLTQSDMYTDSKIYDYVLIDKNKNVYLNFSVDYKLFNEKYDLDNEENNFYYIEGCDIKERYDKKRCDGLESYYTITHDGNNATKEICLESIPYFYEKNTYIAKIQNISKAVHLLFKDISEVIETVSNKEKIEDLQTNNDNAKLTDLQKETYDKSHTDTKKNNDEQKQINLDKENINKQSIGLKNVIDLKNENILMKEKIKELETNNSKLKEMGDENILLIKMLASDNNSLREKLIHSTLKKQTINCDKSISDIINLDLWNVQDLNITAKNISTGKKFEDIEEFLNVYRENQLTILSNFSDKFMKFVELYKSIEGSKFNLERDMRNLISKWLSFTGNPKYNDFYMTPNEFFNFILKYMYYYGYLVIQDCDNKQLFTFITLSKYNKDYAIYFSDYITNYNDNDIVANIDIKEQIINNKNNIVINSNIKGITYFKKISVNLEK